MQYIDLSRLLIPRSSERTLLICNTKVFNRGGVEGTRLDAKVKNTKKIRGQGQKQPFRGQALSRPRVGMLEAKDQGHSRKCSPIKKEKKDLQKSFSGNLQFIGVARIFDWGGQLHAMAL